MPRAKNKDKQNVVAEGEVTPVVHTVDFNSEEYSGPVDAPTPEGLKRTGVDIRTGLPVVKEEPVKAVKNRWDTIDRMSYVAQHNGEGSLNGRSFNFKVGDVVNLNEDEAKLFSNYVTKVEK